MTDFGLKDLDALIDDCLDNFNELPPVVYLNAEEVENCREQIAAKYRVLYTGKSFVYRQVEIRPIYVKSSKTPAPWTSINVSADALQELKYFLAAQEACFFLSFPDFSSLTELLQDNWIHMRPDADQ